MNYMLETERYLINIPQRGVKIIPPAETAEKMRLAKQGQRVGAWSEEEKIRLKLLIDCSILKNRYPTAEAGRDFMVDVDYQRREELYRYAEELSDCILEKWSSISNKPIAIVLYGSTTRGLVKCPEHPDPSNIDLFVTGDISEEKKLILLDEIRPKRLKIKEIILKSCNRVNEQSIGGNAGVHVQHTNKLTVNDYCGVLGYIAANAVALYDPAGVWKRLEKEALEFYKNKLKNKRR